VDGTVAAETVAFGINVKGQIVGQYFSEEDETFHGFLFEPRR
jgi:probable HAF family extracellular repeat protein